MPLDARIVEALCEELAARDDAIRMEATYSPPRAADALRRGWHLVFCVARARTGQGYTRIRVETRKTLEFSATRHGIYQPHNIAQPTTTQPIGT